MTNITVRDNIIIKIIRGGQSKRAVATIVCNSSKFADEINVKKAIEKMHK